jgi:hypothetical protein
LWSESWYFDFVATDGSIGGYVRVGRSPNLGVLWYWACVAGPGRALVTVVDHEVRPPSREGSLELRATGLWADHHCETPLDHWSLALEAFAVSLDDPTDAYRGMIGHRIPLGLDLEWETDGNVFAYPPGLDHYAVPCRVHGEVLVGQERLQLEGFGHREHSWGVRDWWALGWCWSAFRLDGGERVHLVVSTGLAQAVGCWQSPDGDCELLLEGTVRLSGDVGGLPGRMELATTGRVFTVEPLAWAPVLLTGPDGQVARLARAMARFGYEDRVGLGWVELNQPGPPMH